MSTTANVQALIRLYQLNHGWHSFQEFKFQLKTFVKVKIWLLRGGSPGLVVMGGDSCSRGHGFESKYHILDGHFHRTNVL